MTTARRELLDLLERLPDDAPMETLLAELHFKASVLRGLEQAERDEGVSHDEVKERMRAWRTSSGPRKPFGT